MIRQGYLGLNLESAQFIRESLQQKVEEWRMCPSGGGVMKMAALWEM